jgi:AraC-like DNA-binding protein
MPKRRKVITLDDGVSRVWGYNVGRYPLHHFVINRGFQGQIGWPLKLFSAGDDEWKKGCYRNRINSGILALEFVQEGNFLHVQNGRRHVVGPGEVFIIQPGADAEMSLINCEYGLKKTMDIRGPALTALLQSTGLDKHDVVRPANPEWLEEKFDEAHALCHEMSPELLKKCSTLIYELLLDLGRTVVHSEYPAKLQRIISFLEENIGNNLSIDDLCRKFTISSASLHRLCVKHLKLSPIEYFIGIKMEAAKEWLITGSFYSIKEIASQLGYNNQMYFSTEFKKRVGVSPRLFRMKPR